MIKGDLELRNLLMSKFIGETLERVSNLTKNLSSNPRYIVWFPWEDDMPTKPIPFMTNTIDDQGGEKKAV